MKNVCAQAILVLINKFIVYFSRAYVRIFARLGIYLDLVYLVLRRLPLAAFYGSGPSLAAGIGMGIAPPRRRLPAPGGIATAAGAGAGASSASSVDKNQKSSVVVFSQSLQSQ